jgi:hypothetical protein
MALQRATWKNMDGSRHAVDRAVNGLQAHGRGWPGCGAMLKSGGCDFQGDVDGLANLGGALL